MTEKAKVLIEQVNEKIEQLAGLVDDAARSEAMQAFFQTMARFHRYSLNNIFLILDQKPDATFVAGYRDWQNKFDRQVQLGEKGIRILAPCKYKSDPDDPESAWEIRGFRVVTVFDVSQTDGKALPTCPIWDSEEVNKKLDAALRDFAGSRGITIQDNPVRGKGSSAGGTIKIAPDTGTLTLIHEIAHELLHQDKEEMITRQDAEIEAEAVAFVVGSAFGLQSEASPNYLALWAVDPEAIAARANRIRSASIEIIGGITNV